MTEQPEQKRRARRVLAHLLVWGGLVVILGSLGSCAGLPPRMLATGYAPTSLGMALCLVFLAGVLLVLVGALAVGARIDG
jgi:hypothetical protein